MLYQEHPLAILKALVDNQHLNKIKARKILFLDDLSKALDLANKNNGYPIGKLETKEHWKQFLIKISNLPKGQVKNAEQLEVIIEGMGLKTSLATKAKQKLKGSVLLVKEQGAKLKSRMNQSLVANS